MFRRSCVGLTLALLLGCSLVSAAFAQSVERPRITGISHVGYFVSDLPKALEFWHDLLGYDVYGTLPKPDGTGTRIAFVKINDRQHVELFTDAPTTPHNFMSHLCFAVDDIDKMRAFLRANGYDVKPSSGKTKMGDRAFEIHDPNGMLIEFLQAMPDGKEAQAKAKFLPETRISPRIYHAGYMVGNTEKTLAFYRMLGFTETWRGTSDPTMLSWINLKVPDGDDYVELMLYRTMGDPGGWGTKNHLSLMVPDMDKAVATLEARPAFADYSAHAKPVKINTGVNGKRQVNLYDPDGTRVELMEPVTVDGKPRPSSMAPPPPATIPD